MTTNLKSVAGTDFDDLFEAGTGNQLLSIYAMDGQDVGQKYLNVSQGSQVSANTGFQASDSADVRSKLCGKGTNTISYKIWQEYDRGGNYFIYITVSKMPSGNSLVASGTIAVSITETAEGNASTTNNRLNINKTITANGTTWLNSYPCTSGVDELNVYVKQGQVLTLSYLGRTVSISDFLWRTTSHQGTI